MLIYGYVTVAVFRFVEPGRVEEPNQHGADIMAIVGSSGHGHDHAKEANMYRTKVCACWLFLRTIAIANVRYTDAANELNCVYSM